MKEDQRPTGEDYYRCWPNILKKVTFTICNVTIVFFFQGNKSFGALPFALILCQYASWYHVWNTKELCFPLRYKAGSCKDIFFNTLPYVARISELSCSYTMTLKIKLKGIKITTTLHMFVNVMFQIKTTSDLPMSSSANLKLCHMCGFVRLKGVSLLKLYTVYHCIILNIFFSSAG